ncbi:MAG TPA: SDR family NAD(P)-dependent oxidoreductase [Candidatus Acidoferrum sp.]|nr:SDR family NAD(P)-dependent oxidoreductase [Candidatus Acidoferrum sp.]
MLLAASLWSKPLTDVTRTDGIVPLVESTEKERGPITILVNNAGIGGFGPVHEKSEEEWDRVLNTNLKSVFLVSRAVVPAMIRRGGGDIIIIGARRRETFSS